MRAQGQVKRLRAILRGRLLLARWVKRLLLSIAPKTLFELQMRRKRSEEEVALIPSILPAGGVAVDVGANEGLYVYHLQRRASRVLAFEPLPDLAKALARKAAPNVTVHAVALSDREDTLELVHPRHIKSWATIERSNTLSLAPNGDVRRLEVPVERLDSYQLDRLDLLKIDVEGHEMAVLQGAVATISKHRPSLIVEVEERHKPGAIAAVTRFLADLDYEGFYLAQGRTHRLETFDVTRDQCIGNVGISGRQGHYVNNFLFFPRTRSNSCPVATPPG